MLRIRCKPTTPNRKEKERKGRSGWEGTKRRAVQEERGSADLSAQLTLPGIRESLLRQEDSIIFGLLMRAQFRHDDVIYRPGAVPVPGFDAHGNRMSLLDYVLRETEQMHGKLRRYTSPDEHPFFPEDLPALVLPPLKYPKVLQDGSETLNINDTVKRMYTHVLIQDITEPGDDNNHGSAVMEDVFCLQALSRRIHYGKFVAEAKFRDNQDIYVPLIHEQNAPAIMEALTYLDQEQRVVERVRTKAATFGQDVRPSSSGTPDPNEQVNAYKIHPDKVASLYAQWVMPLTKVVQVEYLLHRLPGCNERLGESNWLAEEIAKYDGKMHTAGR